MNGPLDYAVGFGFWRCQTYLNHRKIAVIRIAILITEFHEHTQKVGRCVNEVRVIENY